MTFSLQKKIIKRQKMGNLRQLHVTLNLIDFSSNDFLGLARSSQLATAVLQEWKSLVEPLNGLGSTGSRLLTGNSSYAQNLEERIAEFHGYKTGVLFSCGYMANVGLLSAIATPESVFFYDAEVHASTYDGIRLSRAQAFSFKHNDLEHLEKRLKNCSVLGDRFICIDSIYSTDGSQAPLPEICQLAQEYEAHLIVDEAHAVGIYGPGGRGLLAEHGLTDHVFAQITTFGKALGTYGAIVMGSYTLKQTLLNFATSYIYTTALPFHSLAAIQCSYALFPQLERERRHLRRLIQLFADSYPTSSMTQIQAVSVKGNEGVKQMAQKLRDQGFSVSPLLSPTVQRGHEVLRLCLHAFNTENEMKTLVDHLKTYLTHKERYFD